MEKLILACIRWPKVTIAFISYLVLFSLPFALALAFPDQMRSSNQLLGSGFTKPDSASVAASQTLNDNFGISTRNTLVVVYKSDSSTPVTDPKLQLAVKDSLDRIRDATGLVTATFSFPESGDSSLVSKDGTTTYALLSLEGSDQQVQNAVESARLVAQSNGLQVKVGGGPAFYHDLQNQGKEDIFKLEIIGVLAIAIALILLGRIFRFGLSGLIALVIALTSIPLAWALLYLAANITPISVFAMSIASMLSLAYTTNYSLLLIKSFRRHVSSPHVLSPRDALHFTIADAGETVLGAGIVAILAGLWLAFANGILENSGFGHLTSGTNLVFQSIGLAALLSALCSVLVALGLTLSLLKVKPQWFSPKQVTKDTHSFWRRWDAWVYDHPWISLQLGLLIVILVGTGAFVFKWTWAAYDNVTPTTESREAQTLIADSFGEGESSPLFIIYDSGRESGLWETTSQNEIRSITRWTQVEKYVVRSESITSLGLTIPQQQALHQTGQLSLLSDPTGRLALIKVTPTKDFSDQNTLNWARSVRDELGRAEIQGHVEVAGVPMENVDFLDYDREQLFVMMGGMGLILFIAICFLTQRPILALKAVTMAALAFVMALGSLAWIFTGLGLSEGINGTVPAILLILLAASGTDFEYFLLNPAKQLHEGGSSNREAVLESLDQNRPVILSGAIMLFCAFGVWHFSIVEPVQQIGDGQALGILADVLLIRFVLIAAFMSLLGNANWWVPKLPSRKKRDLGHRLPLPQAPK